jgi:thiamine-monophosphate kinase
VADGLQSLGEFGIIGLFRKDAGPGRRWVVQGIGDDCAVLDAGGKERLLVTTDMLAERVHFLRDGITPFQLGYKSLSVNISDIAAMGGEPTAAFLAWGLTGDLDEAFVTGFRDGLLKCAREFHVDLLGGDTVSCKSDIVVCLTVLGRAEEGEVITRSGARPGDVVMLGGVVGDSGAGLSLILHDTENVSAADRKRLLAAHLEPRPQVELGRLLSTRHLATAMIDVSDGVLQDLSHIAGESGLGADLDADALPLSDAARRLAKSAGVDARDWGLTGGEDYMLLFCVPPDKEAETVSACRVELGLDAVPVGTMTKEKKMRVRRGGTWSEVPIQGYDHFKKTE